MVAASKMRRAQEQVISARPYAEKIRQVLGDLAAQQLGGGDGETHPLLHRRTVRKSLVVHVTPDRGLCGGLTGNINRLVGQHIVDAEVPVSVVAVGKKGQDFMIRSRQDVVGMFGDLGDRPSLADTLPITHLVEGLYSNGDVDRVVLCYSKFVNTVVQEPTTLQILPVEPPDGLNSVAGAGPIFEPGETEVFGALIPRFLEMQVYEAVLESIASEQSARMVAMRNATEAASDMVEALTLDMNKVRQESITNELLDLVGGVAALEG